MPIGVQQQAKIKPDVLEALGSDFSRAIQDVRSDRDRRMKDVWALAQANYEGVADEINWPWPNANNSHIPLTRAHTDAWKARLYNAATSQDPVFLTKGWGADEIVQGVRSEDYATWYQEYSMWAEKEEIPVHVWMEKVTTLVTKFGNAIVYLPFEHEWVMDIEYASDGKRNAVRRDIFNKPVVHVIHPKNFYMPVREESPQEAPWCGFDMDYTPDQVRTLIKLEEWDKAAGNKVLAWHKERNEKQQKADKGNEGVYYKRTEDGKILSEQAYRKEQAKTLRVHENYDYSVIPLVKIFARVDTDGDSIPEEVEFLLHVESKTIVQIFYNRYKHKKRPIVMFSFQWREGTWMHCGVPEILFNIQRLINEMVRDMLNNNKIKNTSVFVARANGVIKSDEPIFPGRIIITEDIERDFKVLPMGTGQISTSIQDVAFMQEWGERADGMTDYNLGKEKTSRTPATTMLALLEEGNERVVSIIHRLRLSQTEVWTQVHQLYAQNRDADGLDRVLGRDIATKVREVWSSMNVEDVRKKLILDARVSTANLNRAVMRQENVALLGQLDTFHQRAISLAQIVQSTTDPVLRSMAIAMLGAGEKLMERILSTHDIKYKAEMNPALSHALKQLPLAPPVPAAPAGPEGQVQQAMGQAASGAPQQPLNAPGRPAAGQPRNDGYGG